MSLHNATTTFLYGVKPAVHTARFALSQGPQHARFPVVFFKQPGITTGLKIMCIIRTQGY